MKTCKYLLIVFIALITLAACSSGGGGGRIDRPQPFPDAPDAGVMGDGRLGELVEWTRAAQDLPAMGVVVVLNGQVIEIAAEGKRSLTGSARVTTADSWHIGSLTKGLTSTLVGVLVEQSVISWDTTPLDVWPELDAIVHPQLRDITVRQLLSHTAGIVPVNSVPSRFGDEAAGSIVEKRRAFAEELLQAGPVGQTGVHRYSNGGYVIVSAMLETLMSAPWETLLTSFVLAPLDMAETGFGAPGAPGEITQPWGHWERNRKFEAVPPGPDADNPQVLAAAGNMHATLQDYASFMIAHIDGARGIDGLVTAATFDQLHAPVADGAALGWGVAESKFFTGQVELAHAGSNQRWYAIVRLVPALNGGALFVVNAGGNRADAAIDRLDDFVAERFLALQ